MVVWVSDALMKLIGSFIDLNCDRDGGHMTGIVLLFIPFLFSLVGCKDTRQIRLIPSPMLLVVYDLFICFSCGHNCVKVIICKSGADFLFLRNVRK